MFPPIVAVIPIFIYAGKLDVVDTYPVLIVPYAAFNLPIAIWILRSTILQIPYEIQEAALVDGASRVHGPARDHPAVARPGHRDGRDPVRDPVLERVSVRAV